MDFLAPRHIGISEQDEARMLQAIGVNSLDELIGQTIPADIRLPQPLNLPLPLTERRYAEHVAELAAKNKLFTSYIGQGWYDTCTPAVIQRNVLENPAWYTSYTPYQAEISQGRLEALLNFQTAVADLTAMPLANASLLDEATAAAEAATMMYHLRSREQVKAGANVLFVDRHTFPQTLAVLRTRMGGQGIEIELGDYAAARFTARHFGAIVQYPNADGSIEDYAALVADAHAAGCKVAVAADLMSLALLTPPGEWGADIVFGSAQRFGTPMYYGDPRRPSSPPATSTSATCRDASSASARTPTAARPSAWPCRPASSTSNVKRPHPTCARHRRCWPSCRASTPCTTGRKASAPSPRASTPSPRTSTSCCPCTATRSRTPTSSTH